MATKRRAPGSTSTRRAAAPQPTMPDLVYAQASPRSIGGASLLDATRTVDHTNVADYMSEASVVRGAVASLQNAGFRVLHVSPTTINIAGPPALYQDYFATRLTAEELPVRKSQDLDTTATFLDCPDTDLPGLVPTDRSPASDYLEGVALERPIYFHQSPFPPKRGYWHLQVPGDVSLGMNADRAHRARVTGSGVRVVMVDSGWYRHPYFVERGYRASPVVLGPAAANPNDDESGHGTGESANVFAVAPDVDLTMVKVNFVNSTGAFNVAAGLAPDVISCSWGSDILNPPLSAADNVAAAAVATAVANGIVVVFSAGNGQAGFPGQHPDVISAGGVFMEPDASLHASDYASGFASLVFPGRNVPDVSGLVGMRPRAAYIMLPMQPGDAIDTDLGNGSAHPDGDETAPDDGWAAISGTSAAAPQIAGICALVKQAAPDLTPAQVKDVLVRTARDVTTGTNHPRWNESAAPGYDLATGHGLADAHSSVLAARLLSGLREQPVPAPAPAVTAPAAGVPLSVEEATAMAAFLTGRGL